MNMMKIGKIMMNMMKIGFGSKNRDEYDETRSESYDHELNVSWSKSNTYRIVIWEIVFTKKNHLHNFLFSKNINVMRSTLINSANYYVI